MYVTDYPNETEKNRKLERKKRAIYILFMILIITRLEDKEISLIEKDNSFTSDN